MLLAQFALEPAKFEPKFEALWAAWDPTGEGLTRERALSADDGLLAFARNHLGSLPARGPPDADGGGGGTEGLGKGSGTEAWEVEMLVELGAADADVAAQARASNSPPVQPWSPPAPAPV